MLQYHSTATTNRGYFVNWANLSNYRFGETEDTSTKPTIEFRQHACSLDAEEIQHCVDLLFAIIRVAEAKVAQVAKSGSREPVDRKGNFAEREGSKYRINDQWHRSTIGEFSGPELLCLSRTESEYWKTRYGMNSR
jgi:hypothetical protein